MQYTAAYLRVSTDRQDHGAQRHAITQYLTGHSVDMSTVRWYEDTITGATMTRIGMDALNKDIFMGTIHCVVVWKLDRIARLMKEGIDLLTSWCDHGVRIVSITEQIDMSGVVGRMIAAVLLAMAEIERENIRSRVKAGMVVAKAKGKCKGRKKGTYKADHMRAKHLRMRGLTYQEIAMAMGIHVTTVSRYMKINTHE
jgi:DNA invertase Pin-like site-specific DNA recombinase